MAAASIMATKQLTADDLDRIVDIDRANAGRSRRDFLGRRLGAALAEPDAFIAIAATGEGGSGAKADPVAGFAIARVQAGEFGDVEPVAILEVIGVDPAARRSGLGKALLAGIEDAMRRRGVHELRTQADWSDQALVGFFAAAGFSLAPRRALARTVAQAPEF